MKNVIEVKGLNKKFFTKKSIVNAVDNVSFNLKKGEIIGLIGESGSGKTTLGRTLINLHNSDSGTISINNREYGGKISRKKRKQLYNDVQMIFQDPYSSLNGQKNIYSILKEALVVKKKPNQYLKELLKDRLEVLKYYNGMLGSYYSTEYWDYRNFANETALLAYENIEHELKNFKINPKLTLLNNYKNLNTIFFEEKFVANSKIISKLDSISTNVRQKYRLLREDVYKQKFKDFDEIKLSKAKSNYEKIEKEIEESKRLTSLKSKLLILEEEHNNETELLDTRIKRTRTNVRAILRNNRKESWFYYKQKNISFDQKEFDNFKVLITLNKIFSRILSRLLNKNKKLIIENLINVVDNERDAFINKLGKDYYKVLSFDNNKINEYVNLTADKIINVSNATLKTFETKIAALDTKIANLKTKIANETEVSKNREMQPLKNAYKTAKLSLEEAQVINEQEINKYKEASKIESDKINEENGKKTAAETKKIEEYKKSCDELLNNIVDDLYKDVSLPHNTAFKNRNKELKEVKSLLKSDFKSNSALESQISKIFNELKSLKKFIGFNHSLDKPLSQYEKHMLKKSLVKSKIFKTLNQVGLSSSNAYGYPHEFSGGMRQRVGIARAIISDPKIIIADEPIAALDLSIQAQIVNLLNEIIKKKGLSMIFIAHDLSMIEYNSDSLMIMHLGKVVEHGSTKKIFKKPIHPYTKNLIKSMPSLTQTKKGFTSEKFSSEYRKEYALGNQPKYHKVTDNHYVLALDNQYKKWKSSKKK